MYTYTYIDTIFGVEVLETAYIGKQ